MSYKKKKNSKIYQKIYDFIKFIFTTIIIMLLIILIFIFIYFYNVGKFNSNDNNIDIPPYNAYIIVSGSMIPTIEINDAIIIKNVDSRSLKTGDVITYFSENPNYYGILVTHRIVGMYDIDDERYFITKGDNNYDNDALSVKEENVYGKVILKIPKVGILRGFISSNYYLILLVTFPSFIIVSMDIYKLIKKVFNKSKQKKC